MRPVYLTHSIWHKFVGCPVSIFPFTSAQEHHSEHFLFFENWTAQIVKQIDFKNSNTYSIVTILHVKQQLFKHIFKFLHYTFSLNNSWPQDFGRIKPLTKLEPIKSPYKKLDLKVDYEHQNHSWATSLSRTLKDHHCKLLLQHQVISWTSLRPPSVSNSQGDFKTLNTRWILTCSFLNYCIS